MKFLNPIRFVFPALVLLLAALIIGPTAGVQAQDGSPTPDAQAAEPQSAQAALGTAFTYQGRLNDAGNPANGAYDFQFKLFDAVSGGTQIGGVVPKNDLPVSGGLFTTDLDFGAGAFDGQARWLEVAVRPGASTGAYTTLAPRRALLASPYAQYSSATRGLTLAENNNIGIGDFAYMGWLHPRPVTPLHILTSDEVPAITITGSGPGSTRYATAIGSHHVVNVGQFLDFYTGDSGSNTEPLTPSQRRMSIDPTGNAEFTSRGKNFVISFGGSEVDLNSHTSDLWISTVSPNDVIINPLGFGTGKVGIGTSTPQTQLHVQGQNDSGIMVTAPGKSTQVLLHVADTGGNDYGYLSLGGNTALRGGNQLSSFAGRVAIGTNNSDPHTKLDVGGIVRTDVLQIDAGADLAEPFVIAGQPEPGLVVAIDPDHIGQLRVADKAYDRTVAGVISGAGGLQPGLTMQQPEVVQGETHPVALTGRVYVWADASFGAIQPGDLLTTSATPGHAMRVGDYAQAQGAILGKAMSRLEEGKGLVLVLVSLQ